MNEYRMFHLMRAAHCPAEKTAALATIIPINIWVEPQPSEHNLFFPCGRPVYRVAPSSVEAIYKAAGLPAPTGIRAVCECMGSLAAQAL